MTLSPVQSIFRCQGSRPLLLLFLIFVTATCTMAASVSPTHYTRQFAAAILGGSGAVGNEVFQHLVALKNCNRIVMVNRRELDLNVSDPKIEQKVVDMNDLEKAAASVLEGVDVAFVTMGVGAPSKTTPEELERVDVHLPTQFAKGAVAAKVRHVMLLTAVGADATAQYSMFTGTKAGGGLYMQVKGRVELNLAALPFVSVNAFRPSTILGTPNTPGAWAAIAPAFDYVLPVKYQSMHARDIAGAMVEQAERELQREEEGGEEHAQKKEVEEKEACEVASPETNELAKRKLKVWEVKDLRKLAEAFRSHNPTSEAKE